MDDISIVLAGAAGQGVQTVEELLVGIMKMSGYHVFATKEYMSRVRGGMNSTAIRISSHPVAAFREHIDILVPLHKDALQHLAEHISDATFVIADEVVCKSCEITNADHMIVLPFTEIAIQVGDKIFSNVVAVGSIAALFKAEQSIAENFIKERFGKKDPSITEKNIIAYNRGYEEGLRLQNKAILKLDLIADPTVKGHLLFNGAQGIGLGAIAGGCNFISSYPMSPATAVLVFLAQQSNKFEILVDQAEDEIAAINKGIAAWYTGARALVSTSGGGFALMEEGISLAAMLETPVVIHIAQRPGPATGLPTRTAQEDLNLALYSGHGEFARIILAPGSIQEAFYLTQKAFNMADKYQIPVFLLTDQYFIDTYYNVPPLDLANIKNEKCIIKTDENYKRYKFTDNGISPRGVPGFGDGLVRVDSDEHDEEGQITENMHLIRPEMVKKRYIKRMDLITAEAREPTMIGTTKATQYVICWGSNFHVVKEALERTRIADVALLHYHQVFPLPATTEKRLKEAKKVVLLENNASGQFGNVIKLYANFTIPHENLFLKYNGVPFSVEEVEDFLRKQFAL